MKKPIFCMFLLIAFVCTLHAETPSSTCGNPTALDPKAPSAPAATRVSEPAQKAAPALACGVREMVFVERPVDREKDHWYANFGYHVRGPHNIADLKLEEGKYPTGGPLHPFDGGRLAKLNLETGATITLMADPKGNFRDPCVSYDARKILFSYRKGGEAQYHLCEINADGTGFRQLTHGIYDEFEPCYLPDGGILFVSSRSKRWVPCFYSQVANLYRCDCDGSNLRRLSANVEQDNTPCVLPDGRILHTRWEYIDRSQVEFHHLWTMNPDGTGQAVFFGNMHSWGVFIDARPIPGTDRVLLIDSPAHGKTEHNGFLSSLTVANGPDDKASLQHLSKADNYRDPFPLSADTWLVAKDKSILLTTNQGKEEVVLFSADLPLHEPRPLVARAREPVPPSKVDLQKTTGTLILTNAYIGRKMAGIQPGEIKKLVVMEALPKPINYGGGLNDQVPISLGGSFGLERLLGTVPVEADGSANFEVPANRAIVLYAADENGSCLKRMHSFLTVMPGESLSCIGCHENRTMAVPPMAKTPGALRRMPSPITPIPGMPEVFEFPRDIQPILNRHCLQCHNPDSPAGGVDLSADRGILFSNAFINLHAKGQISDANNGAGNIAPRRAWDPASPLMAKLTGGHHEVKASPEEITMIRNWINVGAPYPGTYAALGTGQLKDRFLMFGSGISLAETQPAMAAVQRRCASCHDNRIESITEMKSWKLRLNRNRPEAGFTAHLLYNLTRPDKSRILMAPLAKSAGGLSLCWKEKPGEKDSIEPAEIFTDLNDPDYQAILALIRAAQAHLEKNKRFDMPGFKPNPEYVREMKRFGILPESFDVNRDPINVYEIDQKYWESLWHYPPGREPKLYENPVMNRLLLQDGVKRDWETDLTQTVPPPPKNKE